MNNLFKLIVVMTRVHALPKILDYLENFQVKVLLTFRLKRKMLKLDKSFRQFECPMMQIVET